MFPIGGKSFPCANTTIETSTANTLRKIKPVLGLCLAIESPLKMVRAASGLNPHWWLGYRLLLSSLPLSVCPLSISVGFVFPWSSRRFRNALLFYHFRNALVYRFRNALRCSEY